MNYGKKVKELKHGGVRSLVKKAVDLGMKIVFLTGEHPLIKIEYKGKTIFMQKGVVPVKKRMGNMTRNKDLTKAILREFGIKTPRGIIAKSFNEAVTLIKKNNLSYPLIVKPLDGSLAKGVTWDICSKEDLKKSINILNNSESFKESKKFLAEEMFVGDEFRVLIFNEKVLSCVKKIPASVIGDGHSPIRELIENFNKKRMKGFEIKIDIIVKNTLKKNKLTLNSVLPRGFNLKLRNNLNMSDGGRCVEYTNKMHDFFKKICEESIRALGLTYGGVDFMAKNIASKKSPYIVIEVNPNPYYNMHEKPLVEGRGVDVSHKILKSIFSNLK